MTGKKTDDKETGSFLPEDFKNGEYEAAVRLEKQDDLKTVSEHVLTRGDLAYQKEKKLEAEVGSWAFAWAFIILCVLSAAAREVLSLSKLEIHAWWAR